ncbi:class I SAM-dependent methyltransferase [Thiocapsa rosea]|uniref:Methyltransferase family protein n=1 Tax=Thiocapsa rosea TaxID=69360 RepID=A0A495VG56_9GAMM|nr:class I SAM-dependent methyltransferase [Thiocapsa rosea]RKT47425.1 methyltransferase family protein [Thiocapsa rosea]
MMFIERVKCPTCGNSSKITLLSIPFSNPELLRWLNSYYRNRIPKGSLDGMDYILDQCAACGLIWQRQVGDDDLLNSLYEIWIEPKDSQIYNEGRRSVQQALAYVSEVVTVLSYLAINPKDANFLDFGMGWGHWCQVAKSFGCQVYGADLSESKMAQAHANGIPMIDPFFLDSETYFDLINTEQVFEHLANPHRILTGLVRKLKPNGLLKISVPNGTGMEKRVHRISWDVTPSSRPLLMPVQPLEHINCFHRKSLDIFAASVGLVPAKIPLKYEFRYAANMSSLKNAARGLLGITYKNRLYPTYRFYRRGGVDHPFGHPQRGDG